MKIEDIEIGSLIKIRWNRSDKKNMYSICIYLGKDKENIRRFWIYQIRNAGSIKFVGLRTVPWSWFNERNRDDDTRFFTFPEEQEIEC